MGWAFVVALVLIALMVFPAARGIAVLLLIGLVGGVVWLYQDSKTNQAQVEQKIAVARTLITPSQLAFSNVTLGSEYGSYKLKGTIQNNAAVKTYSP